jgi:hypothetical protein
MTEVCECGGGGVGEVGMGEGFQGGALRDRWLLIGLATYENAGR